MSVREATSTTLVALFSGISTPKELVVDYTKLPTKAPEGSPASCEDLGEERLHLRPRALRRRRVVADDALRLQVLRRHLVGVRVHERVRR